MCVSILHTKKREKSSISRINKAHLELARIKAFLFPTLSVIELMLKPYRGIIALQKCVLQDCKVTK